MPNGGSISILGHEGVSLRAGFTLIELLVVVAIIALLIGILTPVLGRARESAASARDLASAQQLMVAYHLYADEHAGMVLPGYRDGLAAMDERGDRVTGLPALRWPWRLLPYFDWNFEAIHHDAEAINSLRDRGPEWHHYAVSLYPKFGLNATFMGGDQNEYGPRADGTLAPAVERLLGNGWFVRRMADAPQPTRLVVFGAAGRGPAPDYFESQFGVLFDGNFVVRSPFLTGRRWSGEKPGADPDPTRFGNLRPTRDGRVISGLLDGHAEALAWERADDMRSWAPTADRRDWLLVSRP